MADFCKDSDPELCGDVVGLCEPGYMVSILCEGCGEVHFVDHLGNRVPWADEEDA